MSVIESPVEGPVMPPIQGAEAGEFIATMLTFKITF
jgi:hypothetical protein